jgi:hypothetical protein
MNQDNKQTTLLLTAVLVMQALMLAFSVASYIADSQLRSGYRAQMKEYQESHAQYEARVAEWQKEYSAYTNSNSESPKP